MTPMVLLGALGELGLTAGLLLLWRIPTCPPAGPCAMESVSIIIPARDEEENLPRLLRSIGGSTIRPAEVLVVDDGSTDRTAMLARSLGARVLAPGERPAGWTGKSWACYQGAQSARGEVFLFLDADTSFVPGGLERLISFWSKKQEQERGLVLSALPYHAMEGAYEQLSIFFHLMMAAGAGGFSAIAPARLFGQSLLLSREVYFAAGGHAAVPGVVLENLRWASRLRECGAKILCLGGEGTLQMRMFPNGFPQMSESLGKALLQGAADSGGVVLGLAIVWISVLWSTLLLLLNSGNTSCVFLAMVYVALSMQIAWMSRRLGSYRPWMCLLYPLPLSYFCFLFGRAALRSALGRKAMWRGRQV
jgi:4,4'-diaponeurosporenoate glycosyltransferase